MDVAQQVSELLQVHLDKPQLVDMSPKVDDAIWSSPLMIPAYVASASVLTLLLHVVLLSRPVRRLRSRFYVSESHDVSPEGNTEVYPGVLAQATGFVFGFDIARTIGCLVLLSLSIATFIVQKQQESEGDSSQNLAQHKGNPKFYHGDYYPFSRTEWLQLAFCMSAAYASLLGLVNVLAKPMWSRLASKHLAVLLLASFGVYSYRDVYPLVTFTESPADLQEGWLLWAKLSILTLIGVIIPLITPHTYVPVDPQHPAKEPHPEQTASWLSALAYTWLDPTVFLAYKVPHLSHDQLPPLADYDHSQYLINKSFTHLDPFLVKTKRHIFFGLMRVYRAEYIAMACMVVLQVFSTLSSPVGINRLLTYLETDGEGAVIRPWVWIAWLFLGPTIGSMAFQWYIFIATSTLVRAEAILTQLIFDHSLRIRMVAELPDGGKRSEEVASDTSSLADSTTVAGDESPNSPSASVDEADSSSSVTVKSSINNKGKQKAKDGDENTRKDEDLSSTSQSSAGNLIGKINNLVTTDLTNITDGRDFLLLILYIPLQISLCILFLYQILGWSALVGLLVMVVLFPLPGKVAQLIQTVQKERMKRTDARVGIVTETMNVLRMIKMFGWENKMKQRVVEKREEELDWTWKRMLLDLLNNNLNFVIPAITMLATYSTYTVLMKQNLTAATVFSSMSVFDILRDQLHLVFQTAPRIIQGRVSLDRVNDFLHSTELLDQFSEKTETAADLFEANEAESTDIGFRDAVFAWSNENTGVLTPSKRKFNLRIDDEVLFQRGHINLIIGPTGSGKTSMLMALLGELHFVPSSPTSWYNLPRKGGVAYAAQESWIQNETIRDNIIFGAHFNEERYKKVLYQCGLERDLSLFEAGDKTEVGEKGLTLSGGQKARITLARAIYSSAAIILLDDVLAALDVHTAKWIVDKCFAGDLVKGRTIILVTHNVPMTSPIADYVVSLANGRVLSQGSVSDALAKDAKLAAEALKVKEMNEKSQETVDEQEPNTDKADGKLIVEEEVALGRVGWPAFKLYLSGLGGIHPALFWFFFMAGMVICNFLNTFQTWFLGYWATQYNDHDPADISVNYYISIYATIVLFDCALYSFAYTVYMYGALRAFRVIHETLIESILGTTLRWLDTTPTSRVITRCTQDIRAVDGPISQGFTWIVELSIAMIFRLAAVVTMTPVFLFPGLVDGAIGAWFGRIYMKAQLSVKREMSNARAPVLGHFGAAIAGLTSIRAYGAQDAFKAESLARIDRYTSSARMFYNLNRWVCIRIDGLGALFSAGLAAYLVYGPGATGASNIGFSLNMAVSFSSMILWWIRILNDVEVNANSLERIHGYINIEQEPKSTPEGNPPAYWPASGELRAEGLSARYSSDGPKVLHDLSFHIRSGERVGIVGRTGSGKSSLALSLLRCIFTDGNVYYDGIPMSSVNLDALRSNITIIPQIPELLSGSLRKNLDPFDQHDDLTLNDALRAAGLSSVQDEEDESRLTLDSAISSGGGNLSVGQRQILALARAMVRGSKLLILDEATSAIDYKTDAAIQSSLRTELSNGITQIIVAHRLQTIIDADKIMVLDAGKIAEFGSPAELLQNEKGLLRALVDESGEKETLYAMANKASGPS